jgi:hypothetical protein
MALFKPSNQPLLYRLAAMPKRGCPSYIYTIKTRPHIHHSLTFIALSAKEETGAGLVTSYYTFIFFFVVLVVGVKNYGWDWNVF